LPRYSFGVGPATNEIRYRKAPLARGFLVSPLTDSNRRPPPYQWNVSGNWSLPTATVFACLSRSRRPPICDRLPPVATRAPLKAPCCVVGSDHDVKTPWLMVLKAFAAFGAASMPPVATAGLHTAPSCVLDRRADRARADLRGACNRHLERPRGALPQLDAAVLEDGRPLRVD
jgi:hypothetical protein